MRAASDRRPQTVREDCWRPDWSRTDRARSFAGRFTELIHRARDECRHLLARHWIARAVGRIRRAVVRPEKKAAAIEQKKTLVFGTSVNRDVTEAPPQVPVV